ncbi:MAG TPA: M1 family metallopeptidase [Bryobacteraceae bacterium]|nr:M1 family metallopeptidase [Bryobacteraceae bacterium]
MTRFVTACVLSCSFLCIPGRAQKDAPKLRLPTTVRPVRYSADLRMTPGQDRFTGSIAIELEISQPVSTIWLHAKSLSFEKLTMHIADRDEPAQAIPGVNDLIAVTAAGTLPAGHATLQIAYSGEISRTLTDGAFQQQQGTDWYIFTKFEPVTSRRVFPCFDEPSFKVPWQLTLHVPKNLKAFSNTSIVSEQGETNGTKAVRFEETKPLPPYLVAFAVGPFDVVETEPVGKNRRPSRIVVPRARASEAAYAASITPKLMAMLEDYFGMPYPYEKLDQIVVPLTTAWGAMENAGLIAYGDFLLSPKEQDTELRQRSRAGTMEHEMSHQWFGDLVTTAWWDDIWLNEAFASWLSSKLLDEWKPEWNIKADASRSLNVLRADSLTTARRIRQPIEAPGDIANAFDGITYGKGEAVIAMFENYMGPLDFQRAIRLYLLQHAWGNATSADLLATLDSVSQGVGPAFSTFLNQVGFPLVSMKLGCITEQMSSVSDTFARLQFEQQRFVPAGSQANRSAAWDVPVCASWEDEAGTHHDCKLLTGPTQPIKLNGAKGCPAWFFADWNAAGYYAVSYDARRADGLMKRGLSHLKPDESAAALRNIQLMFSSGVGDPEQQLASVSQFSHSSDPGLVRQAAGTIAGLSDFVPGDLSRKYERLIRSLYDARARELGWTPHAGESQETRLLRIEIVPLAATYGADPELSSQATLLAREWLNNRQALDSDMVEPVLSTAAWNGDRAFFDRLVDENKGDKIQRERSWMITALESFRDPAITRARLNLMFGAGIDPRELQYMLFGAPPHARELVWDFARQNFDRLNATLPGARGIPFGALVPLTASGFCDAAHRQQVQSFFQPRIATLPGGARNLANTVERIDLCSARAAVVRPAIVTFLNEQ